MILLKAKLEAIMKYSKYSTVIIGSGISGLYAALKIEQTANAPDGILVVTKSELGESNSKYAQGGMVGVLKENINDNPALHISDTIKAGAGLSEFNTVKFVSENSDKVIKDLLNFGVEFDCDENGELTYTLEAAHSVSRVLHSGGDATGRMIELALTKKVKENNNIDVYENNIAVDLLVSESECKGVIVFNDITKEYETIYSPVVILATGGIGQIYKYTTNPIGATGDGLALAYRAGLQLQDMEFVQFHPTALAIGDGNRFLISEAVRGEGAKLVNSDGIEFMQKYDDRKELAPRDIVTRANYNEMAKNNTDCVYLNATCISSEKLAKRFPTISKKCMENGIDISKDYIPVAPAAHYFMGGIKSDIGGATSVHGLFAIGETASTGLHGANRLASNSLLECVICAYEVANRLKSVNLNAPKQINKELKSIIDTYSNDIDVDEIDILKLKSELKNTMWNNVGILRDEFSLNNAIEAIKAISSKFTYESKCFSKEEYELRNMITVAQLIAESALNRKESRGAHYRTDFTSAYENAEHSIIAKKEGELCFVK
jgi:L-aspartate oxidase